jgi:hypothetical protein
MDGGSNVRLMLWALYISDASRVSFLDEGVASST